jgi:hypothetical protein
LKSKYLPLMLLLSSTACASQLTDSITIGVNALNSNNASLAAASSAGAASYNAPLASADESFTEKAGQVKTDVEHQIHVKHFDNSVKQKLESDVRNLLDMAASIDQRQASIEKEQSHVDDLEMINEYAKSNADELASQLDQDAQSAKTKIQNLINQLGTTCRSLNGNWNPQGADAACTRTVSCTSDQPDVCDSQKQQFESAFNNAAGPVKSQIAALKQSLEQEQQRVQDASHASDYAKSDFDQANSALARDTKKLDTDKQAFEDLSDQIQSKAGLPKAPGGLHPGRMITETLSDEILLALETTPAYQTITGLYDQNKDNPAWSNSEQGINVIGLQRLMHDDAEAISFVGPKDDPILQWSVGGVKTLIGNFHQNDLEGDPGYRRGVASLIAKSIGQSAQVKKFLDSLPAANSGTK